MRQSFRAKRLPALSGAAGWDAILPQRAASAPLDARITADFCIIGAGFAGLSAARRILQIDPQAKVVVLEAGQVGQGSAGRNSGFMIDLPHELTSHDYAGESDALDRQLIALNRQAIGFAEQAVADYAIPQGYFLRDGKVNGAVSAAAEAANISYAGHLAKLGEPFEVYDAQQMHALTGSHHYRSGLFTPGSVMLQPAGYVRGLAQGLARQIRLFENTPVTGLARARHGWNVETRKGHVSAGKVILATNGHLESFGFERGRLLQLFLFACMTEELSPEALRALGGAERWGVTPSDPMGTTMRRISTAQGGHRIITRTIATVLPEMQTRPAHLAYAQKIMREKFDARYPQLGGVRMEHLWAGHLCLSLNNVSVTGEIEKDLYAACVQNGLGTTRGTLTGIAAAETALGEASAVTRFFAQQARPSRLPPRPIAKIGANMFIRWKEFKARSE